MPVALPIAVYPERFLIDGEMLPIAQNLVKRNIVTVQETAYLLSCDRSLFFHILKRIRSKDEPPFRTGKSLMGEVVVGASIT